jgi:ubiquinone biosynthesis protein
MLLGFFNRDYATIVQAHLRAGWVPANTNAAEFEQAIRVVCEPIFAKPISEISFGNVLMQLFQTVRRFEMPVQPQLVLLYKTLLNIEGLGRQLYPQLNLWDMAKPFLENWMKDQLSPKGLIDEFQRDWPQWRALLPEIPLLLSALVDERKAGSRTKPVKKNSIRSQFGMLATVSGVAMSLVSQHSSMIDANLTHIGPWVAAVGLITLILSR